MLKISFIVTILLQSLLVLNLKLLDNIISNSLVYFLLANINWTIFENSIQKIKFATNWKMEFCLVL
jgi:hypothetical protein